MQEGRFLNYNGKLVPSDQPLIKANNRSFRYGDGCFETMRWQNGKILLANNHFERLFSSLEKLRFDITQFAVQNIIQQVEKLVKKNAHIKLARIRLTVFRGEGGLYDEMNHFPNYCIQSWPLSLKKNELNHNGLLVGIYKEARKVTDQFSVIKSNNYQPYLLGALWAKQQQVNDAIILNCFDRIADATIANIFIVKDGIVKTPALTEGGIAGVMRKYVLHCCRQEGIRVEETTIAVDELKEAKEVFLTNAITGIRWVKEIEDIHFDNKVSSLLYKHYIEPLFHS